VNKFKVLIEMGNDAFDQDDGRPELARILRELADRVENGKECRETFLRDINGNIVGKAMKTDKLRQDATWG
jgi:hypothetical protein